MSDGGRRVLVCGGRDYNDKARVYAALAGWTIAEICHGAARGADSLADSYARERSIPCVRYPADWDKYGKAAGAIRNRRMLDEFNPDLVVAFPGGRGTAHMVGIAQAAGVDVCSVVARSSSPTEGP